MSSKTITSRPVSIDRAASSGIVSRTSWGEESHIRVGPADSGGQLTILDYRAPASFGPPRHLHHREDEVLELIEGQAVFWTPHLSFVLAPGDLVLLPNLSSVRTPGGLMVPRVSVSRRRSPPAVSNAFSRISSGGAFLPLTWPT